MRRTARPVRRGAAAGFTLVELLTTLFLMALISAALLGGLRFGLKAWATGTAHATASAEVDGVARLLGRLIAGAIPIVERDPRERRTVRFSGARDRLTLVAALPPHLGPGGLYELTLARDSDGTLVLRRRLLRDGDGAIGTTSAIPLIEAATDLRLAYYGTRATETAPRWHETWRDEAVLPALVRLDLAFADGDPRTWRPLHLATRIDGPRR